MRFEVDRGDFWIGLQRLGIKMHDWNAYYELVGTAAAALLGLLFVAISLNADLILAGDRPQTKQLSEQAFQNYVAVLIVALLLVVPGLDVGALAPSLVAQATFWTVLVVIRLKKTSGIADASFGRFRVWRRLIPCLFAFGLMIFAGVELTRHHETSAFQMVGFATALLLVSATVTSWDLLVRVAEIRHESGRRTTPELGEMPPRY